MNDYLPADPMPAAQEAAVLQKEIFDTWVRAGFTEAQALDLLKALITAQVGKS